MGRKTTPMSKLFIFYVEAQGNPRQMEVETAFFEKEPDPRWVK
jgi:hypothetical protein